MENRIKKDMYNSSPIDLRTYVNGETAIKPYYYFRNGLLHVRYNVDRCVELSPSEIAKLKVDLTSGRKDKQEVLADAWNFFTTCVERPIIMDGVAEFEKRLKGNNNGYQG